MTIPCRWRDGGLGDFAGKVRFRRRFGLPRRIDAHERLWLTFASVAGAADVSLNGQLLGRHDDSAEPFEFEVTSLLKPRNELIVDVQAGANGGIWGQVALDIRCTAYLRRVGISTASGRIQASGEVVGVADRPLDLYLLVNNATVAYTTVEVATEGRSFEMAGELAATPVEVRVELVNGATVWYQVVETIDGGAA
jgi:hypothetical protein